MSKGEVIFFQEGEGSAPPLIERLNALPQKARIKCPARLKRQFAEAGFQGYMSVEYEKELFRGEDAMTGAPKLVA